MLNKEEFVRIMDIIISQIKRNEELYRKVDDILRNDFLFGITYKIIDNLIEFLEETMNDKSSNPIIGSTISWWVFDAPNCGRNKKACKIYFPDNSEVSIHTPADIYDYLVNRNNS